MSTRHIVYTPNKFTRISLQPKILIQKIYSLNATQNNSRKANYLSKISLWKTERIYTVNSIPILPEETPFTPFKYSELAKCAIAFPLHSPTNYSKSTHNQSDRGRDHNNQKLKMGINKLNKFNYQAKELPNLTTS